MIRKLTQPISPKITKPLFHPPPEPYVINTNLHLPPSKATSNIHNTSLQELNEKREDRINKQRALINEKYKESEEFIFHESKLNRRDENIPTTDKESSDPTFNTKLHRQSIPNFNQQPRLPIPLTTASVLREGHIAMKISDRENQLLHAYEINLRDATEYEARKATLQAFDEACDLKVVETRREHAKMSLKEMQLAMSSDIENKRVLAGHIRSQGEESLLRKQLDAEILRQEKRQQAEQLSKENERNLQSVKKNQLKERVLNSRTIRNESLRNDRKILILQRLEEQKKQLRAQSVKELIPHTRLIPAPFDPTTVANQGYLLDQVSYQELQDRLHAEKLQLQELESKRRRDIEASKANKKAELEKCMKMIMKCRQNRSNFSTTRQQLKQRLEESCRIAHQSKLDNSIALHQQELYQTLTKRAEEAQAKQQKAVEISRHLQDLTVKAESAKNTRADEVTKSQDRQARELRDAEARELAANELVCALELKNQSVIKAKNESLAREKETERRVALDEAVQLAALQQNATSEKRASLRQKVRADEEKMKETIRNLNPYAAQISLEVRQDVLNNKSIT